MPDKHTPESVKDDLFQMGRTLRHLYVKGCWPAGHQSSMPDYVRDSFAGALDPEGNYHDVEVIRAAPSSKEISHMDEVIQWMHHIPQDTLYCSYENLTFRRLVWKRIMAGKRGRVSQIARDHGTSRQNIYRWFDYAIDCVVNSLNRSRAA